MLASAQRAQRGHLVASLMLAGASSWKPLGACRGAVHLLSIHACPPVCSGEAASEHATVASTGSRVRACVHVKPL